MVFDRESPPRRAQNMSALLAIIILIGVIIPIPLGAGFADWINETNAPIAIDEDHGDDKYANFTIDDDDFYEWDLFDGAGDKAYFYWWNHSGDGMKHNVTNTAGVLTADLDETEGLWQYVYTDGGTDDEADWTDEGDIPYWEVTFDFTAKDAYDGNVVLMKLMLKDLVGADNDEEEQNAYVTLTAGGVEFFSAMIEYDESDDDIEEEFIIDVDDLRTAIANEGVTSYFVLKVVGCAGTTANEMGGIDQLELDMTGTQMYTYNVGKLFSRDDGLYLAAMISTIICALGIFLVTPKYSLPFGKRGY